MADTLENAVTRELITPCHFNSFQSQCGTAHSRRRNEGGGVESTFPTVTEIPISLSPTRTYPTLDSNATYCPTSNIQNPGPVGDCVQEESRNLLQRADLGHPGALTSPCKQVFVRISL